MFPTLAKDLSQKQVIKDPKIENDSSFALFSGYIFVENLLHVSNQSYHFQLLRVGNIEIFSIQHTFAKITSICYF